MLLVRDLRGPVFEKTAGQYRLGDNPATYPSELLAQLYKQHAYLGKYEVNLNVEGQDPTGSYMYGVFMVRPAQDVPPDQGTSRMGEVVRPPEQPQEDDRKMLRVPVVVENKKAYSFDTFITPDGKFYPLNEGRVAAMLFDAGTFSVAPVPSPDHPASPSFQPDTPAGGGRGMGPNESIKSASILPAIAAYIDQRAATELLEKVAASTSLSDARRLNPDFNQSLIRLEAAAAMEKTAAKKTPVATIDENFDAAVVTKVDGGYQIKTATAAEYTVHTHTVPNADASDIPLNIRELVFTKGAAVLVPEDRDTLAAPTPSKDLKEVCSSGVYAVMTKAGSVSRAVVLTDVETLSGRKTDLKLVVGKPGASLQEKVAGIRCGDLDLGTIRGAEPRGQGMFLFKEAEVVSEPVTIDAMVTSGGVESYLYHTDMGKKGHLVKTAGVLKPIQAAGDDYLLPEGAVFIPLTFGARYSSDETHMEKVASRHDHRNRVTLVSDSSGFHFHGTPVQSLEKTAGYSVGEALLVLGCLGDTASGSTTKIAAAEEVGKVDFVATRDITQPVEQDVSQVAVYATHIARSIQTDLLKEAAALGGPDTVDAVLSLNFITPENVQGYVDALPDLEGAVSRLAELLMGVRLGLSDVPESAVSSALRGTERAIQGLKKMQIRLDAETAA